MIYGYIRVSTDKQTVENQRFEIIKYAKRKNIIINRWVEETISGTISAEIERSLLSQRTTEALKRKKAEGIKLGRPLGRKSTKYKLSGKEELIIEMLDAGFSKTYITKYLGVSSATLYSFIKRTKIYIP